MRGFMSKEECPVLHASTYDAGWSLPLVPVDNPADAELMAAAERKRIGARQPLGFGFLTEILGENSGSKIGVEIKD